MNFLFLDVEATDQWAPYCDLTLIGYQYGLDTDDKPEYIKYPEEKDSEKSALLLSRLGSADWFTVGFNSINYDCMVLARHGYPINLDNHHDVYLMAKTVSPTLPAYGLKFLNYYFYKDIHFQEGRLKFNRQKGIETFENLAEYNMYDVIQTVRLFKLFWPEVQKPLHKDAYKLEMAFGPVLHEMMLEGGEWISIEDIDKKILELTDVNVDLNKKVIEWTEGFVRNANSREQIARFLTEVDGVELEITDKGNLQVQQSDLLSLLDLDDPTKDRNKLARLVYDVRRIIKQLSYLRGYRRAALHESTLYPHSRKVQNAQGKEIWWISKCYSSSRARTRRILSSSKYQINFQNSDHTAKFIQLVPPGYIGCWVDQTQVENVVHIWASQDKVRRAAYEADVNWNEYVWLENTISGIKRNREELEIIPSPVHPSWSRYKHYKTVKLAMNFFMGLRKFCKYNGIPESVGKEMFEQVHQACPAIRQLLKIVKYAILENGYIQDPFGHIYSGSFDQIYKVVAYFIQGCGTGSVTKAIARAIYDTLHPKGDRPLGQMNGILHDETAFRIRVDLSDEIILETLRRCLYNAEQQFSCKFDDIPLRAKLSVSITNCAEAEMVDHHNLSSIEWNTRILNYVNKARIKAEQWNSDASYPLTRASNPVDGHFTGPLPE